MPSRSFVVDLAVATAKAIEIMRREEPIVEVITTDRVVEGTGARAALRIVPRES